MSIHTIMVAHISIEIKVISILPTFGIVELFKTLHTALDVKM